MASHKRRPVRALVTLIVAIVAACAALAIGHFVKGVSPYPDLALDLKGGTQLILTPTVTAEGQREITDDDITQAISIIRNRIDASGVSESEISSMGNSNIMVAIPGDTFTGTARSDPFILTDELPPRAAHRCGAGQCP